MLPSFFKKTAIAGAFDFSFDQAELPRKTASGRLVGAFNLPRLADLMNASDYRHSVTHILLADNSIHALTPDMTFYAEGGKVQVKAKDKAIGDLLLLYYNDSSMLKLERRAVRLIGGKEYGQRLARLQQFMEQQQPEREDSMRDVFEKASAPRRADTNKQATPENLKLCAGIVAGDAESLGQYFARNMRLLHQNLFKYQFDKYTEDDIIGTVQSKLVDKMLTGTWSYGDTPITMIAYINRCIDNKAKDILRDQRRHHTLSIEYTERDDDDHGGSGHYILADLLEPDPSVAISECFQNPLLLAEQADAAAYVQAIRDYITENPKTPVRHGLEYAEAFLQNPDLTQTEWAEFLGRSEGTIKTNMARTRATLAKIGLGPEALRNGTFSGAVSSVDALKQGIKYSL